MPQCIFPDCHSLAVNGKWCRQHEGLFPHNCEYEGCDARPIYDDEPYCFSHSPDSGSSIRGYSASEKWLKANSAKSSEYPEVHEGYVSISYYEYAEHLVGQEAERHVEWEDDEHPHWSPNNWVHQFIKGLEEGRRIRITIERL